MKNIYAYMCVAVMSCVIIVPSHAVSFRSVKNKVRNFYNGQPLHRKQAAIGVPLLTLGIVLESVYGGKQQEIAERVGRLKQQLGRGTNKALKKQIRKLQFQRGGHIVLQIFAALSSLFGGALTISALWHLLHSFSAPRVGGSQDTTRAPGANKGGRQSFQGVSGQPLGGKRVSELPRDTQAKAAEDRRQALRTAQGIGPQ